MALPNPTDFLEAFGHRVQSLRKNQNLTQLDLSVQTGIEIRQLRRIEKGKTNTSIWNLRVLAEVFGVEMSEILGEGTNNA